jgi:hypothetical protein
MKLIILVILELSNLNMNKIFKQNLHFLNLSKKNIINVNNSKLKNVILKSNFLNISNKQFTVNYEDLEKKLEKFYESKEKERKEYLIKIMTNKEKNEADIFFKHLDQLDELELEYFKSKLEVECKKLNIDLFDDSPNLSKMADFIPMEIEGYNFSPNQNLLKNISPFFGQPKQVKAGNNFYYHSC